MEVLIALKSCFILSNILSYKMMFEGLCNWDEVMAAKTVREFDASFTAPLFKYKSWADYYHDAALYWKVLRIPIPTLCLNAADDCFSPIKCTSYLISTFAPYFYL